MSLSSRIAARRGLPTGRCPEPACVRSPGHKELCSDGSGRTWGYRDEPTDSWLPEWRRRLTARDMTFADR